MPGGATAEAGSGTMEVGSRYDLRAGRSPDAPETEGFEGTEQVHGWVHSYETGSTVDGPGVRLMLFMSGCFLRCRYCHNPDTWRMKDGTRIELPHAVRRLADFAPAGASSTLGVRVTVRDVNGDGKADILTSSGELVTAFAGGSLPPAGTRPPVLRAYDPYPEYGGGVWVG